MFDLRHFTIVMLKVWCVVLVDLLLLLLLSFIFIKAYFFAHECINTLIKVCRTKVICSSFPLNRCYSYVYIYARVGSCFQLVAIFHHPSSKEASQSSLPESMFHICGEHSRPQIDQ